MDIKAIQIVTSYIKDQLNINNNFDVFIVWKSKALQNWKYLISTDLYDGMYYELTFNGDRHEWYLDAYKKIENRVIADY